MTQPDNPGLRQQVRDYIDTQGDASLSWVETHGLLCALACGPNNVEGWQNLLLEDDDVPAEIQSALAGLRARLHSQLGLGETIQMPCRLDPYEENDGADLTSWCAGFITGVSANEDAWHEQESEQVFEMLLPFLLISGLDEDPELDTLWQDDKLVRQMAMGIPDLLEEIFLFYYAPELSNDDDDGEDNDDE
ncbi:MAG: YecA family protein [Alcanivoracaceae bacterium]|nr:YecA family protein [Alcanivoracaceae bacterium]